jgi:catechol 2,3-dioxygenase-like lactoylglutathione lyase family enzyme
MDAQELNPILNVSDIAQSFDWFEKFGWKKEWDWGEPPTFGAVGSGKCGIFLCQNAQGGRGRSALPTTKLAGDSGDMGVWMSIWVADVDAIHRHCLEQGLEVSMPPTDEPWGVREMHVRHPDGHIFRVTQRDKGEE